jgi:hypothetical protein
MGMRRLARSIVAARADREARQAGRRVKAPGKFRRWLFQGGWEKAKRTWRHNPSWTSPTKQRHPAKFAERPGVSL